VAPDLNISSLKLNEIRNSLRDELKREIDNKMAEVQRSFERFSADIKRDQDEHHKENRSRLQSIDHHARNNGQMALDQAVVINGMDTRLGLLYDDSGKGYFHDLKCEVIDLKKELQKLNNKIMYATGFAAAVYIGVNLLKGHKLF
jgi:hypothetical protein